MKRYLILVAVALGIISCGNNKKDESSPNKIENEEYQSHQSLDRRAQSSSNKVVSLKGDITL